MPHKVLSLDSPPIGIVLQRGMKFFETVAGHVVKQLR